MAAFVPIAGEGHLEAGKEQTASKSLPMGPPACYPTAVAAPCAMGHTGLSPCPAPVLCLLTGRELLAAFYNPSELCGRPSQDVSPQVPRGCTRRHQSRERVKLMA